MEPPSSPQAAPAEHSGFLHKRGHVNTAFKRRFFVLRAARLTYYEDEAAAVRGKSRGSVTVRRVRHLRQGEAEPLVHEDGLPASHIPFAFRFETAERKPFFVYADSMDAKLSWLRALHQASRLGGGSVPSSPMPGSPTSSFAASAAAAASPESGGGISASHHSSSGVEDEYREHVSAVEAGLEATLGEPLGWRCVADGVAHARAGRDAEAEVEFNVALGHVGSSSATAGPLTPGSGSFSRRASSCKEPVELAALHESGKVHCAARRYADALTRFEDALRVAPPKVSRPLRLQCAWCSWQLGRHAHAEQLYAALLEEDPTCRHTVLDRARMHLGRARWRDARTDLDLVLAMDASTGVKGAPTAELLIDRAVCCYELGEGAEALATLTRAVQLLSGGGASETLVRARALVNRGNAHRLLEQVGAAIDDYTAAMLADPKCAEALNNRGALKLHQGELSEAVKDLAGALRLQPQYEVAARNLEAAERQMAEETAEKEVVRVSLPVVLS